MVIYSLYFGFSFVDRKTFDFCLTKTKTLAASGIADLSKLLGHVASHNPLGRNVTIDEVGNTAAFLLSELSSGITGEITYVDGGYSINALNDEEA